MDDLYRLLPEEMEDMVTSMGERRFRADQILLPLYYKYTEKIGDIRQLSKTFREELAGRGYTIGSARETHRIVSEDGRTVKSLLELPDGAPVETVLMQYDPGSILEKHPRSTVCVSTQVGCAMGCVFCATGQMGFGRQMRAEEIISQVIHFAKILKEKGQHVTNLVFMGMGEPLANYDETVRAIRILTHPRGYGMGQRHITVSTIGLVPAIDRLADEDLQIGMAISLHAPGDELRRRLVPTARPSSVSELVSAGVRYFKKTGRRVTIEYALIAGVNDAPRTARELAELLKGNGFHVNLIPLNPTAGDFSRPVRKRVLEFEKILQAAGVNCTVRVEKGSEIAAACGQLRTDAASRQKPGSAHPA